MLKNWQKVAKRREEDEEKVAKKKPEGKWNAQINKASSSSSVVVKEGADCALHFERIIRSYSSTNGINKRPWLVSVEMGRASFLIVQRLLRHSQSTHKL